MKALSDLQTQQIKKLALASEEGMALMKKTQQLAEEVRSMTHAPMLPTLAADIPLPALSSGYSCMLHASVQLQRPRITARRLTRCCFASLFHHPFNKRPFTA